jgi:predicted AAA+ superfamily ATPase
VIDILKEIILDFQKIDLPTGITRRVKITPVSGKATVCIGVRRSGKSTFMFQLMQRLQDADVLRQNILYLN